MNKLKSKIRGFTLIEIVVAFLVLLIGFLGLLALFPVGFDAAGRSQNLMRATYLAQSEMENIKKLGYYGVASVSKTQLETPFEAFDYKVDVTNVKSDLKKIEATIYWPSGTAEESQHLISLVTYLARF
ncbi:MAG: prepilin-type N-terminal cleavage/methylation domain-containing protein [Candidatus Omnitrophica bacterium]|nr:prepilin-type N-terminal cleavage/methylation domain-containing protein [Candidatus Omnitrophota bacterium]